MTKRLLTLLCAGIALLGCWRIPENFASLPLEEQVKVYEIRFKHGGVRNSYAERLITAHGYAAAEAMVPYIVGKKSGIPPFVAINITWSVQARGCDLRRSSAEDALRSFLRNNQGRHDGKIAAESALEEIEGEVHGASASERLPSEVCARPNRDLIDNQ